MARFTGTPGRDVMTGTEFRDLMFSREGDDNVHAKGGNDIVNGGDGSDILIGGTGNDQVLAGLGDQTSDVNTLFGVETLDTNPGRGELDNLVGGSGKDIFVLGTRNKVYYDDGNNASAGENDNALIKNFTSGVDTIEVKGSPTEYGLFFDDFGFGSSVQDDTKIVRINPFGGPHEVIGFVEDVTNFTSGDFTYL